MSQSITRIPALDINFLDPDISLDPYPHYEKIRALGPAVWNPTLDGWMVVNYADIKQIHVDLDNFTSEEGRAPKQQGEVLSTIDGPMHRKIRLVWHSSFMRSTVEKLSGQFDELVDSLIAEPVAEMKQGKQVNVLPAIRRLPSTVIGRMLGVPPRKSEAFIRLGDAISDMVFSGLPDDHPIEIRRMQAFAEFNELMLDEVKDRRRNLGDDLISELLRSQVAEELTDEQIAVHSGFLLFAGNETTARLISSVLRILADRPETLKEVVADRSLVPAAIEETLRFDSVVQVNYRAVKSDAANIGGVHIPRGDEVLTFTAAANRDPARYADPDTFDIHRSTQGHFGFGFGFHSCLGLNLARVESIAFLNRFLDQVPDFEVAGLDQGVPFPIRGYAKLFLKAKGIS